MSDLTLYNAAISGNCYKIRLLLAQLKRSYRQIEVDLLKGESRTDEFKKLNPFYRVPFLIDGDFKLGESNAILLYLARDSFLLPSDPKLQALIHQWMFFEQNQVTASIAVSRFVTRFESHEPNTKTILETHRKRGLGALAVLENHLKQHHFLLDHGYSVADISLFGYIPLSAEGGFSLDEYPSIREWISRVREQPNFIAMD